MNTSDTKKARLLGKYEQMNISDTKKARLLGKYEQMNISDTNKGQIIRLVWTNENQWYK